MLARVLDPSLRSGHAKNGISQLLRRYAQFLESHRTVLHDIVAPEQVYLSDGQRCARQELQNPSKEV